MDLGAEGSKGMMTRGVGRLTIVSISSRSSPTFFRSPGAKVVGEAVFGWGSECISEAVLFPPRSFRSPFHQVHGGVSSLRLLTLYTD